MITINRDIPIALCIFINSITVAVANAHIQSQATYSLHPSLISGGTQENPSGTVIQADFIFSAMEQKPDKKPIKTCNSGYSYKKESDLCIKYTSPRLVCPKNSKLNKNTCTITYELYNESNYIHEIDDGNIWAETLFIDGKKVFMGNSGNIPHNLNHNGAIYNLGSLKKSTGGMISQSWYSLKKTLHTPAEIQCSTGQPYKDKCRLTKQPKIIYR